MNFQVKFNYSVAKTRILTDFDHLRTPWVVFLWNVNSYFACFRFRGSKSGSKPICHINGNTKKKIMHINAKIFIVIDTEIKKAFQLTPKRILFFTFWKKII